MRICKEDNCTREFYSLGFCQKHWQKQYYEKNKEAYLAREKKYVNSGKEPGTPKGHVGYFHAHKRIRIARGAAREQMCPCGNQALQWSLRPGMGEHSQMIRGYDCPYSLNVHNYDALCRACHRARDDKGGSR